MHGLVFFLDFSQSVLRSKMIAVEIYHLSCTVTFLVVKLSSALAWHQTVAVGHLNNSLFDRLFNIKLSTVGLCRQLFWSAISIVQFSTVSFYFICFIVIWEFELLLKTTQLIFIHRINHCWNFGSKFFVQ